MILHLKLKSCFQRPFGQRVANIGTWQNALAVLGFAAVIVNCALIGLSGQVSRLWPGLSSTHTIILIVTLEHVMLGLRTALTWLLPELPSWLAAEIARAEHCRREMQCRGVSPHMTPSPPSTATSTSHDKTFDQINSDVTDDPTNDSRPHLTENIIFHHIAPIPPKSRNYDDIDDDNFSQAPSDHIVFEPILQVYILDLSLIRDVLLYL